MVTREISVTPLGACCPTFERTRNSTNDLTASWLCTLVKSCDATGSLGLDIV